jgi:hypothetical protein
VNLYPRLIRTAAIMALCSLGLVVSSTGANAAGLQSKGGPSHLSPATTPQPDGPSGCTAGDFCTYENGNGGTLCEQFDSTQNLSTTCAGDTDSSFDNSSVGVELFAGVSEGGAYYFLGASDYLLYETTNDFNQCGVSCGDYGGEIYNHLQSVQFE